MNAEPKTSVGDLVVCIDCDTSALAAKSGILADGFKQIGAAFENLSKKLDELNAPTAVPEIEYPGRAIYAEKRHQDAPPGTLASLLRDLADRQRARMITDDRYLLLASADRLEALENGGCSCRKH